jgi:hypothetical protein
LALIPSALPTLKEPLGRTGIRPVWIAATSARTARPRVRSRQGRFCKHRISGFLRLSKTKTANFVLRTDLPWSPNASRLRTEAFTLRRRMGQVGSPIKRIGIQTLAVGAASVLRPGCRLHSSFLLRDGQPDHRFGSGGGLQILWRSPACLQARWAARCANGRREGLAPVSWKRMIGVHPAMGASCGNRRRSSKTSPGSHRSR